MSSNPMKPIIEIKNIGKRYLITHQRGGYIALRDVLTDILYNPFRFAKRKAKQMAGFETKEEFWALRNISLEINRGDVVGIIGANGAGKSTLLKILTGITPPTEGEIIMRGRIASLLEVGTGFHPELTGRENIFLNGAIMGMTRREIARKFDEIIAFAGVEQFLDTPVKYYSSGMYVRLAFSVAAHMEPDILLVDEVLAVGDAEFQKKCLGKMEEVTQKEGRTILFVSHNMTAIERLCGKCVLLEKGKIKAFDTTEKIIKTYLNKDKPLNSVIEYQVLDNLDSQILKVSILDKSRKPTTQIPVSENFFLEFEVDIKNKTQSKLLFIQFSRENELLFISSNGDATGKYQEYAPGKYKITAEIPAFLFQVGMIALYAQFKNLSGGKIPDAVDNITVEITSKNNPRQNIYGDNNLGKMATVLNYETRKIG